MISTMLSCQKNIDHLNIESELKGNTFDIISIEEKDTLTIEFKDSTYSVFSSSAFFEAMYRKLPWRVTTFDNNQFLVMAYKTFAIKQLDKNTFDGLLIGVKDYEYTLKKRNPKWNKELLIGTWVMNELNDYYKNDSIPKTPPNLIPPPLPPPNFKHKRDFQEQSLYDITLDSINVKYGYSESKSKIHINSSFEFITMDVKSNFRITEQVWKIKTLTDSIMVVDKIIMENNDDYNGVNVKTIENIVLIKKRFANTVYN